MTRNLRRRRRPPRHRGTDLPPEPGRIQSASLVQSISWRLALGFIAVGTAIGLIIHFCVGSDFDRRGSIRTSEGRDLSYELQGMGPPLVLLAGGPGTSHHVFHPYLGGLSDRSTLIYFDPRGRGGSDRTETYTVSDDVQDIESLRSILGLRPVDLLGHSYGAHLALAYALEHPSAVHELVLVSPIVGPRAWREHLERLREAPGVDALLSARREDGEALDLLSDLDARRRLFEQLEPLYRCEGHSDRRRNSHPIVLRTWHRWPEQNFEVYASIVGPRFGRLEGDLAGSKIEGRLTTLETPTLIVTGRCDRVIPKGHPEWLRSTLAHATLVRFDASGHAPFVDEPRRFADVIGAFLHERR